ncbi:MAG TPA: 16S rRNA (guanine(527)-N(7))-methyltransferase RsmG [Phaeodactylibacter sp.]|nr:16S rRNA (guanine(527)-N(7))-methyltransferase RsmG [Phaeodactylibacter sp.]
MQEELLDYFPDLTEKQLHQFAQLDGLYAEWNAKINVISRKDIEHLFEKHILHSLAIAKIIDFAPHSDILDLGTGGGFPGIPLAILFPEVNFMLVDGTRKKITVVNEVVQALGLKNVVAQQARAEELKGKKFDFVVTRAVATLDKLMMWTQRLYKKQHQHAMPNGLIALKGGNLKKEIKTLGKGHYVEKTSVWDFFEGEFFEEKFIVYVQG